MRETMTMLDTLAAKIKSAHECAVAAANKSFRHAKEAGLGLLEAKSQLQHGEFLPFCRNLGIAPRTAQIYMTVAKSADRAPFKSIAQFLTEVKKAKRQAHRDARDTERAGTILHAAPHEQYRIHHADCREFDWPHDLDAIFTDPPWADLDAYRWLADFAADHLRDGGLLMVQVGNAEIGNVVPILTSKLNYVWTCAIMYYEGKPIMGRFLGLVRPVLMLSKGSWDRDGLACGTDAITVHDNSNVKNLHEWQQPVEPWLQWISAWTRPGALIADPFAGSGTMAEAVMMAGGNRRLLGTEIDADHSRVAQGRVIKAEEKKAA